MAGKKPVSDTTEKKLRNLKPFKSGAEWTGNAAGRPKSSRHKLNEDFLKALCDDFEQHGRGAITTVREKEPAKYLTVVAQLVPKDVDVNIKGGEIFEKLWRLIGEDVVAALPDEEGDDANAVH
jgi:hypothetical protein